VAFAAAILDQFLFVPCLRLRRGWSAMKGIIELVAGAGLDKNDIEEIQNAIEAVIQGTSYEELFSITTAHEIESDTSIYYVRIIPPFGATTDNYSGMEDRLQSSLRCHVEFASR
jgi:hypothetical protein